MHPLSTKQALGVGGRDGLLLPLCRGARGAETGRPSRAGWHVGRLVRPKLLGEEERSGAIPGGLGRRAAYIPVF